MSCVIGKTCNHDKIRYELQDPYTPTRRVTYLFTTVFDSVFKKESFLWTVPSVASAVCSTSAVSEWDNIQTNGQSIFLAEQH